MMKKVASIVLLILVLFSTTISLAYSGDSYDIEVPTSFASALNDYMENYWGDGNGNSVSIQISQIKNANEFQYSEEFLKALTDEVLNNIDSYKKEIKEELIAQYETALQGLDISREEIEEVVNPIVDSMKYNDFLVKEVTTFTKNNYPCLHYISSLSAGEENMYSEIYQLVSDKTAYTITISSNDAKFFDKQEIKDMVNSFTIKNYKPYAFDNSKTSKLDYKAYIGIGCVVVAAIVSAISKAAQKKKINNDNASINKGEE